MPALDVEEAERGRGGMRQRMRQSVVGQTMAMKGHIMRVTFRAEERERVRRNDGSVESRVEVIASGRGFDGVVVFSAWLFLSNPDARRAFTLALAQRLVDIEAYAGKYVSHDMMMLVAEDQRVEEQLAGLIHSA